MTTKKMHKYEDWSDDNEVDQEDKPDRCQTMVPYDKSLGLYRDIYTNYITGEMGIVGKFDVHSQTMIPLLSQEKDLALAMGIVLPSEEV